MITLLYFPTYPIPILSHPVSSHPILPHLIPSHPILSHSYLIHPVSFHPVPYYPLSHPILFHLISSHLTPSHPIPSPDISFNKKQLIQGAPIEKHKNGFVNLAAPFVAFSEPLEAEPLDASGAGEGRGFTIWDKVVVDGAADMTVRGLLAFLKSDRGWVDSFLFFSTGEDERTAV